MHNTSNAMVNLVNRYKSVLDKCQLINTFGSLALATSMTVTGTVCGLASSVLIVGDAEAATASFTPTLHDGIYEDTIKGQLTDLGTLNAYVEKDQNGDITLSYTWEQYIKDTTSFKSWASYTKTVDELFDGISTTPAYTLASGIASDSPDYYSTFTISSVSSSDTSSQYTITETSYGVSLKTS